MGTALNTASGEVSYIQSGMAGDHTFQGSKPGAGAPDNVYRVGRSCVEPQERQRWLGSRMPHGVSDIQESLEEALPGMEQGPLLLPGFSTLTSLGAVLETSPTVDGGLSQMFS